MSGSCGEEDLQKGPPMGTKEWSRCETHSQRPGADASRQSGNCGVESRKAGHGPNNPRHSVVPSSSARSPHLRCPLGTSAARDAGEHRRRRTQGQPSPSSKRVLPGNLTCSAICVTKDSRAHFNSGWTREVPVDGGCARGWKGGRHAWRCHGGKVVVGNEMCSRTVQNQ